MVNEPSVFEPLKFYCSYYFVKIVIFRPSQAQFSSISGTAGVHIPFISLAGSERFIFGALSNTGSISDAASLWVSRSGFSAPLALGGARWPGQSSLIFGVNRVPASEAAANPWVTSMGHPSRPQAIPWTDVSALAGSQVNPWTDGAFLTSA